MSSAGEYHIILNGSLVNNCITSTDTVTME
jgi:hypothetical protein